MIECYYYFVFFSIWVGDELVLNYTGGVDGYIDTGTSLIVGPPGDIYKVLTSMNIDMGLEVTAYHYFKKIDSKLATDISQKTK